MGAIPGLRIRLHRVHARDTVVVQTSLERLRISSASRLAGHVMEEIVYRAFFPGYLGVHVYVQSGGGSAGLRSIACTKDRLQLRTIGGLVADEEPFQGRRLGSLSWRIALERNTPLRIGGEDVVKLSRDAGEIVSGKDVQEEVSDRLKFAFVHAHEVGIGAQILEGQEIGTPTVTAYKYA